MNHPQQPSASNFRTTYLADRGAVVLAEHALTLPAGHPARETIQLLLERRTDGQPFDPDASPAITRDHMVGILSGSRDAGYLWEAVCSHFGVDDDEIDGARGETIMAEAV